MRKLVHVILTSLAVALLGCVTINVYFPEAAAQKAADQFIGNVLDRTAPRRGRQRRNRRSRPTATTGSHRAFGRCCWTCSIPARAGAETPNISIQTPQIQAIQARMQQRFDGALGANAGQRRGRLHPRRHGRRARRREGAAEPARAGQRRGRRREPRSRRAVPRRSPVANGHPEWEPQIRATFAKQLDRAAHAGWYYQDAAGAWQKK